MTIEDKIKKQAEVLKRLKGKAKAEAKAKAEREAVEAKRIQFAAGEIVLKWRESGYRHQVHELRNAVEKLFAAPAPVPAPVPVSETETETETE